MPSTTRSASSRARSRAAAARPATCTARSAPAKAISWRCWTCCWPAIVRARAIPELAAVVNRHDRWLPGKRFLMVPYHMIGARDVESAILGGYAEHVRRLHPKAPIPGFYLGERLFDDARRPAGAVGRRGVLRQAERRQGRRRRRLGRPRRRLGCRVVRGRDAGTAGGRGTPAPRRRSDRHASSPATPTSPRRAARPSSTSTPASRS